MEIAGLKALWAETLGHPHICIAVLDGPVDRSHPSLAAANLTPIETLAAGVSDRGPAGRHGTHIASVIFGQHDGPVKGIAPQCRGVIVPIFRDGPDGSITPCSQLDLARAISQAVQAGAHIINISGGELTPSGAAQPILADAVQSCAAQGVLIVAAAGNDGCACLHVPGALPLVLAVGAMDGQGQPMGFSNWGPQYRSQGILAPGENILGAIPGGGAAAQSGTSYATPLVSGIAALILSLQHKLGQTIEPQAGRTALLESAIPCDAEDGADCRPFMRGRLNVSGAHRLIAKGPGLEPLKQLAQASQGNGTMSYNQPLPPQALARLKMGSVAPDFTVKDQTGRVMRLSDFSGQTVVLWFYPEADTPG
jgi:cyanobactin maturation PatA/PatG family protease